MSGISVVAGPFSPQGLISLSLNGTNPTADSLAVDEVLEFLDSLLQLLMSSSGPINDVFELGDGLLLAVALLLLDLVLAEFDSLPPPVGAKHSLQVVVGQAHLHQLLLQKIYADLGWDRTILQGVDHFHSFQIILQLHRGNTFFDHKSLGFIVPLNFNGKYEFARAS